MDEYEGWYRYPGTNFDGNGHGDGYAFGIGGGNGWGYGLGFGAYPGAYIDMAQPGNGDSLPVTNFREDC